MKFGRKRFSADLQKGILGKNCMEKTHKGRDQKVSELSYFISVASSGPRGVGQAR